VRLPSSCLELIPLQFSLSLHDGVPCVVNRIVLSSERVIGDALNHDFSVVAAGEEGMQQDVLPLPIAPKMAIPVNKPRSGIVSQEGALAGHRFARVVHLADDKKEVIPLTGIGILGKASWRDVLAGPERKDVEARKHGGAEKVWRG